MNYRKLLEKYMREVVIIKGTSFVSDVWGERAEGIGEENKFSFKEHAVLLKLREKIVKEKNHEIS